MKIVLIGGGSFVFAPTVLEDVIVKHRLAGAELVLVDPNEEAVLAMAGAGRRVARDMGVEVAISGVTEREAALVGADYVIVSAAPQGARRWQMDYDILCEYGMADQARECGGLGGMLNAFRSITLVIEVCRDMERVCPDAWLLDVTNPMPRVVTAVDKYTNIKCAGFCNIAWRGPDGYDYLPQLLGRSPADVEIVTAGLNHFAWVVALRERRTGANLLPELERFLREGDHTRFDGYIQRELKAMRRWLEQYGAVMAGAVDHHGEYLPVEPNVHYPTEPPYHGTEEERRARLQELQAIADGTLDWHDRLFIHPSWEHPVDVAVALERNKVQSGDSGIRQRFDILNVRNRGAMSQLPADRIVEVPVEIAGDTIKPVAVPTFPAPLAELLHAVSDVHELVAEAAVRGDVEIARLAIERDPAITDKAVAKQALDRMLAAHRDLLPQFG